MTSLLCRLCIFSLKKVKGLFTCLGVLYYDLARQIIMLCVIMISLHQHVIDLIRGEVSV